MSSELNQDVNLVSFHKLFRVNERKASFHHRMTKQRPEVNTPGNKMSAAIGHVADQEEMQ